MATTTSEVHRQLVHAAAGGFAFLLRDLVWWQAAMMAAAAVTVNVTLLPRMAPRLFRAGDLDRPWRSGIVIYPLAVLALILVFARRLDLAAAAWAILAAGDAAATLVGAHVRSPALPWNPRKSVGGLAAFLVAGSAAGVWLMLWTTGSAAPPWWLVAMPTAAAVVAGFVETAPIRLDDNISVPIAAALALASLAAVDPAIFEGAVTASAGALAFGAGLNLIVAAGGLAAATVTGPGALAGAAIGTLIFAGAGWSGWLLLIASFALAVATTRLGHRRKAALGIAEARGGRRGPANAIANTGVAAWAAAVALGLPDPSWAWLALAAALVTGASDTVASEIGKAWGRTTWLVSGFRRVPPGTSGAISLEGTAAGLAAAAALSSLAWGVGLIAPAAVVLVVAAATVASLVEGALGATFEASGILDNDALNLVNTLVGAGLALAFRAVF